jgi:CPA1 family monovalent cation:H+ antiporter
MEYALVGVIGVVTLVAVSVFARRLGVAAPLVLVVVGVAYSFIPAVGLVEVPPWLILEALLPPLLYSSAVQVPLLDFKRNLRAISVLSVTLVIVTSLGIGFFLFAVLPKLDLGAAIALGAVVSPTDAVAATAIAKRLGLPDRLVTVLEGESLVNDASALVILKAAIGAAGASISIWNVAGDFLYSVVIALLVGFVVGVVTVFVRSKFRDSVLDTTISFAIPFIAYIPAESLGASGVLAVVVAGLYSGHKGAKYFTPQARISERLNWRTIQFVLENGVFLLMGLQLRTIVMQVPEGELGVWGSVGLGLAVVVLLLALRAIFVGPLLLGLRRSRQQAAQSSSRVDRMLEVVRLRPTPVDDRDGRRLARTERMLTRRSIDMAEAQRDPIGWRGGIVITWAGMRGVVTLAAAQSLPEGTPYRPQLILIAFTVAIVTLLLQGGTLPLVIRLSKVRGNDKEAEQEQLRALVDELDAAAMDVLNADDLRQPNGDPFDEAILAGVRKQIANHGEWEQNRFNHAEIVGPMTPTQQYQELTIRMLAAERDALLQVRSLGTYPSRLLARAQSVLDVEEARMQRGAGWS